MKTLLGLIITLNLYEVVMIALALFLIIRRGLRRDGWILLGIESAFPGRSHKSERRVLHRNAPAWAGG